MVYLLSLDQGSSNSKASLMTAAGRMAFVASVPVKTVRRRPSWAEHSPGEIRRSIIDAAETVIRRAGTGRVEIAAAGLASQRSTLLVWERETGRPLMPAVSWQDLRAAEEAEGFSGEARKIYDRTGLVLSAHYAALKLRWVLRNVPGARARAEAGNLLCGTVTTFLLWHFSRGAVHRIDPTHAARMLLMDIRKLKWDPWLCDLFGIPDRMLPEIAPSVSDYGTIRVCGRKIPIRASIGDNQAALAGLGAARKGDAVINLGTGGFLLVHTGPTRIPVPGLLSSVAWTLPNRTEYVVEGTVNAVGTVFDWFERVGLIRSRGEIDGLVRRARGEVFMLPSPSGLGSPHWNRMSRMAVWGIHSATTRGDLVRSAAEGIAFLFRDIYDSIRNDRRIRIRRLTGGGGGIRMRSLVQAQADVLGVPIYIGNTAEGTLAGAARLAGVGCGWWNDPSEAPVQRPGRAVFPGPDRAGREKRYRSWKSAFKAISADV
jgi:glycerol kinase